MKSHYLLMLILLTSFNFYSCKEVIKSINSDETRTDLATDYQDIIEAIARTNDIDIEELQKELDKDYLISEEARFYDFDTTYGYMMSPRNDKRNYDLELILDKNKRFIGIYKYKP